MSLNYAFKTETEISKFVFLSPVTFKLFGLIVIFLKESIVCNTCSRLNLLHEFSVIIPVSHSPLIFLRVSPYQRDVVSYIRKEKEEFVGHRTVFTGKIFSCRNWLQVNKKKKVEGILCTKDITRIFF